MEDIMHRIGVKSPTPEPTYQALATIDWRLHQAEDYTIVTFTHQGWAEPVEFMHHCGTKWGAFLLSLKALVETGHGAPSPRDVPISDWG